MEHACERRPWLVPLALAVLTLIFLRPVIIPPGPGQVLNSNDLQKMFYPLQSFIRAGVEAGELPLWNPHEFIGHPVAGNPQAALFYPGTWLVWLIGVQRGIGLVLAIHTWWGAWGLARLARRLGSGHVGSLLAGVVYAMSGWAGARLFAGHFTMLLVFGWLPWALVAFDQALARRTRLALLPGIGVIGVALLAGHPPLMVYLGLGLAGLWLYHAAGASDPLRAGWDAGWRLAVIGGGGLILGMAAVLPAAELTREAAREAGDLVFANAHALPPAQLLSALALPELFGNPTEPPYHYWGADFFEEFTAYAGLLPLLALPLVFRGLRRESWYFIGLIAFGLLLSIGLDGPLLPLLVRWVPGFGYFRDPSRGLLLVVIGLAGLTGQLVTRLQTASLAERRAVLEPVLTRWLPLAGGLALAGAVFFSGWYASASHVEPMPLRATLVAGALAKAGLILGGVWLALWLWTRSEPDARRWALIVTALVIVLDAWHVALPIIDVGEMPEAPIWTGARGNIPLEADGPVAGRVLELQPWGGPVNEANLTGHYHVLGYDPLPVDSYDRLQTLADPNDPLSRINTLLGVTYLLATGPVDDPAFELIGIAYDSFYYRRTDPFPRAWMPSEVMVEPNDDAVRAHLLDPAVDLRQTVYLDEAPRCPGPGGGTATITRYEANQVEVKVEGEGGLLVLSDQFYPGWQATVAGQETEIYRADTALRAVCVPGGAHTVRFEYRPRSVAVGAAISAAGWGLWLIGMAFWWWHGWRDRRRAARRASGKDTDPYSSRLDRMA